MGTLANAGEVVKELRKVRQIRQYRPAPVPDEVLAELLQVARWTGSSRNTQPWHLIVVTDEELLRQISEIRPPIHWVAGAPLAIAIVLDGESLQSEAYDEGRVSERLLVAAHLLGLGGGTAWFGDESQRQRGKEILGIPAERMARSVVVLGYPVSSKDPRPGAVAGGRKPLSELVSYNRLGKPKG